MGWKRDREKDQIARDSLVITLLEEARVRGVGDIERHDGRELARSWVVKKDAQGRFR